MKRLLATILLTCSLLLPSNAQNTTQPSQEPAHSQPSQSQTAPSKPPYYTNKDGHRVKSPIQAPSAPAGATAQCRDGSWSFSQHRRGTCSHHGGVSTWIVQWRSASWGKQENAARKRRLSVSFADAEAKGCVKLKTINKAQIVPLLACSTLGRHQRHPEGQSRSPDRAADRWQGHRASVGTAVPV